MPDENIRNAYVPSSPTLRRQLLSDASDHDEQMQEVSDDSSNQIRIGTEDATPECVDRVERLFQLAECGPETDGLSSLEADEQSPIREAHHAIPLKLEPPGFELFRSADNRLRPNAKGATFFPTLETIWPERVICDEHSSDSMDQPFQDDLLAHPAHEAAQAVEKQINEEKLEPADTTMRVDVLKLDAIRPVLPGTTTSCSKFLQETVDEHLKNTERTFDEAEEREMEWAPLPRHHLKSLPGESIEPAPELDEWISQPAFSIKSEDLLWRPIELRILTLDEEDDDEELDEDPLLKDEPAPTSHPPLKRHAALDVPDSSVKRRDGQTSVSGSKLDKFDFGSLAGFMDTRKAHKKPRLGMDAEPKDAVSSKASYSTHSNTNIEGVVQAPATPTDFPVIDMAALCAPEVPNTTSSRTIIASSRLLNSHRHLMQALETRPTPPLIVIYRDLETGNKAGDQPDIILSPPPSPHSPASKQPHNELFPDKVRPSHKSSNTYSVSPNSTSDFSS